MHMAIDRQGILREVQYLGDNLEEGEGGGTEAGTLPLE